MGNIRKKYGDGTKFDIREEDNRKIRTMTLKDAMEHLHGTYGIGENGKDLLKTANEMIDGFYRNEVCLKDGVAEFLSYCKTSGIRACIASATQRDYVESAVKHCEIGEYFCGIISCADIGKGKEHPDVFLAAAERMNTKPDETCVFEDSLTALITAHRAGLKTVGIYDRYGYGQDRIAQIADEYIAEGETLKKLIPTME